MNQGQIYNILVQNGASPEEAQMLSAISMAESGGNPGASNISDIEKSYGLFQINTNVHGLSPQQAMDPNASAQYALSLARSQGYKPWSVFLNGSYKQFLEGGDNVPNLPTPDPNNPFYYDKNFTPDPSVSNNPNGYPRHEPIPGPGGSVIGYIVWYDEKNFDTLTPEEFANLQKYGTKKPDKPPVDSAAASSNAAANMISAKAQRMNALMDAYGDLVAAGDLPRKQAMEAFLAEIQKIDAETSRGQLALDTAKNEETSRREREIGESSRRLGVAEEAGRRAKTMAQDILPKFVPGATSMTLPGLGTMPLTQINPDQLFNQGGVGDLSQLPAINPNPSVPFPGAPPMTLPQVPQPAPPMSIDEAMKVILQFTGGSF